MHVTHHAIAVGGNAIQEHGTAQFLQPRHQVAAGRSLLEEEVEMRHLGG